MQKRPKSIARLLSERARGGEPESATIAALGGTASDILGHLKDVFEQVVQAAGSARQGDAGGEVPFTLGGKEGRMVFGYTMRVGLDGVKAEPFGDIPPKADAARKPAARAPIVDVFEEAGSIRIVAELPGASSENVICTLEGDTLRIETRPGEAPLGPVYAKTVQLPAAVDPASLVQSCRNGILEIRIDRAAG